MASLQQIQSLLSFDLTKLNDQIHSQLTGGSVLMDKVVNTYLRVHGKQLRPIVLMLCARMFGDINDKVISSAAAVEILHNASLIHDDIVDDTMVRRCKPTINSLWDSHVAVLVGDFFVSTAMQRAISTGDINIIESLCHLGKLLSLGEIDQVYNATTLSFDIDDYYKIISYKTASLFVACAKMGCYAQGLGTDDARLKALAEFAEYLGLCFQIKDDIFDYLGNEETIGKPTGNDLKEGKVTLPLLYALKTGPEYQAAHYRAMIARDHLTDEEIAEIIRFAIENGGISFAFEEMERLRKKAESVVAPFVGDENLDLLLSLFSYVISRER